MNEDSWRLETMIFIRTSSRWSWVLGTSCKEVFAEGGGTLVLDPRRGDGFTQETHMFCSWNHIPSICQPRFFEFMAIASLFGYLWYLDCTVWASGLSKKPWFPVQIFPTQPIHCQVLPPSSPISIHFHCIPITPWELPRISSIQLYAINNQRLHHGISH